MSHQNLSGRDAGAGLDEVPTSVPIAELLGLLELERPAVDVFLGGHTALSAQIDHVFGGLVAAQALVAAGRTVAADRAVHSLHAHFLRAGDHRVPVEYRVDRTRDGGSFSHREVTAHQRDREIATFSCSFALPLEGPEHAVRPPVVPGPDALRPDHEVLADRPGVHPTARAVDVVELRTVPGDPAQLAVWMRATGPVGDDPLLHAAVLTYASDLRILQPVLRPHRASLLDDAGSRVHPATLDHTVWFHETPRTDTWLLMTAESPWAAHGRGLVRGAVFDDTGRLVAEVAQEALVRFRT